MSLPFDPEWDAERRVRLAELQAKAQEPVASMLKQRELREKFERGEFADDVNGHRAEPDRGG
jgi:hypothetical protein